MTDRNTETIECGNCGSVIPITAKNCPHCGIVLFDDVAGQELLDLNSEPPVYQEKTNLSPYRTNKNAEPIKAATKNVVEPIPAYIVDFDMPFGSIVGFMVKVALAAIPATLILLVFYLIIWLILGGVLRSIF